MSDDVKELRARLRGATLGAERKADCEMVEWGGEKFEVRRPSLKQSKAIETGSKNKDGVTDSYRALVLGIVHTVYVPGTSERVFDERDADGLMESDLRGYVGAFANAIKKLSAEATPEQAEKN